MIENYGNVRAVLNELRLALKNLRETGETYSISGIWIGTYKNGRDDSILHTVEVAKYPVVAGAYIEDMELAEEDLQSWIDAAGL